MAAAPKVGPTRLLGEFDGVDYPPRPPGAFEHSAEGNALSFAF